MRTMQGFIVRLLIDSDERQTLRGSVRRVGEADEYTFAHGQALLYWLQHLSDLPQQQANPPSHARDDQQTETREEEVP